MFGKNSRVAKRIQEIQPKAFDTHYHCHSLSLSVKDSTKKSPLLYTVITTSKEIVTLSHIKFSLKREKIYGGIKANIECKEDENNAVPGLAKFSATR